MSGFCNRVAVTVSVELMRCGSLTGPRELFEQGGSRQPIALPVPSWLIRHPQGIVLFDTGMPEELAGPGAYLDAVSTIFQVGLTTRELVRVRLEEHDVDPADVDVVVVSHLHFDHVGGLAQLPDARVVVHADEWAAGLDADLAAANAFRRAEYDLGHDIVTVDGEHDVFGDGRIVTVPTPGHTPGHQSLRVRLDHREVVLCGDCAYFESTLMGGNLPPIAHDHDQQARSIRRLRDLRDADALVIPGHDGITFRTLPACLGS